MQAGDICRCAAASVRSRAAMTNERIEVRARIMQQPMQVMTAVDMLTTLPGLERSSV
jgi:hypothetical protein